MFAHRPAPQPPRKELIGKSGPYHVRIYMIGDEKLVLSVEHETTRKKQSAILKHEDVRRESAKIGVDTIIDSASMLYLVIENQILERNTTLGKLVEIGTNFEFRLHLQMRVDFKNGAKTKMLNYSFPTYTMREPSPPTASRQLKGSHISHDLHEKVRVLEEQNIKIKAQLEKLHQKIESQSLITEHFEILPDTLRIKNDEALNLTRNIQYIYQKKSLHSEKQYTIVMKSIGNSLLFFDMFKYEHLKSNYKEHNFRIEWYKKWLHCKGNQILTVRVNETGYTVVVEKNQIEEVSIGGDDEDNSERLPNFSYSKQRINVEFKHMIPLSSMHLGFGFEFGGGVKILSISEQPFDFK